MSQIEKLVGLSQLHDEDGWRTAVRAMELDTVNVKSDFRVPHDPVFAAAIKMFHIRRVQLDLWLGSGWRPKIPQGLGLSIAREYMSEAAEIVQVAAEAYVFNVRAPRKRAKALLKKVDPRPLKKRIDAREKVYENEFGPDDGSLIDLDARPEAVVDSKD